MGIFTGIAYRLSLHARRGTARRKAFASHSIRRATLAVLTKKPSPTPTPCGIRIDVLNAFGIEAFQRMPRARAPLVLGHARFFVALCFRFLFVSRNDFSLAAIPRGFRLRGPAPRAGAGTTLSLRGGVKQRLAKGHLWNPFGEQVLECNAESYKGAPMRMSTLRASSRNKPCILVCRRAFSERSRQLAVFGMRLKSTFRTICRRESSPYALSSRAGHACA